MTNHTLEPFEDRSFNFDNIAWSLDVSENLLIRYGNHSAFGGYQPVNEPWYLTPMNALKEFYRDVRKLVRRYAPQAKFIFHDAFHYQPDDWKDLFPEDDLDGVVLDHHYYFAFQDDNYRIGDLCWAIKREADLANAHKMDVWWGEWSITSDNCAQHLNGFNDGKMNTHGGVIKCAQVECPKSYLPDDTAVDFDRTADMLGPLGSNGDN